MGCPMSTSQSSRCFKLVTRKLGLMLINDLSYSEARDATRRRAHPGTSTITLLHIGSRLAGSVSKGPRMLLGFLAAGYALDFQVGPICSMRALWRSTPEI